MVENTEKFRKELQKPFSRLSFYWIALSSLFTPSLAYAQLIAKYGSTWKEEERQAIKEACFNDFKSHFWREFRFFGTGSVLIFLITCFWGEANVVFAARCFAAVIVLASISYDISKDKQGAFTELLHQSVTGKIRETFRVLSAFILLLIFATS